MSWVYDDRGNQNRLLRLAERGVKTWGPERVYVGEDVDLQRISPGAELFNGRITGAHTFIGTGAQIGISGIACIHESQIGSFCVVGAGTYDHCVLLCRAKARGFAEIRQGTLLEEEAEIGHNVGLKHTVFTAGVVAGSSINFCDVLLTGGSSRADHSEVGSGVVHFNFDPRCDKFGSLMGDATGCLLRSRRIFIGGNSGIVAPVHVEFGAVIAAGSTIRRDVGRDQLSSGDAAGKSGDHDFERYHDLSRKFYTTAKLVGNLHALCAWYRWIRSAGADSEGTILYAAADVELQRHIKHRSDQLLNVVDKLEGFCHKRSTSRQDRACQEQHKKLLQSRDDLRGFLRNDEYLQPPTSFLADYERRRGKMNHVDAVRALSNSSVKLGVAWLRKIASKPSVRMRALFTNVVRN